MGGPQAMRNNMISRNSQLGDAGGAASFHLVGRPRPDRYQKRCWENAAATIRRNSVNGRAATPAKI